MKKLILLVAVFGMVLGGIAFAGNSSFPREGKNEPGYVNVTSRSTDGILVGSPIKIYAATIFPSSSNSSINIYDNSSAATGTVKVEISGATAFESKRYTFDPPISMENGAYVDVTTASAVLEYR